MDRVLKLVSPLVAADPSEPMMRLEGHVSDHALRIAEAILFAADGPVSAETLTEALPKTVVAADVIARLAEHYRGRGVELARVAGGYCFRTAQDLSFLIARDKPEPRKIGRAALEILAIIAYHQPVTRAEIEDIRGVATSKGTLDVLLEAGWIRMRGRRRTPGRPVTYGTTPAFLAQFSLDRISDLPGIDELKGAGFVDGGAASFAIPSPSDADTLRDDEDALESDLYQTLAEARDDEGEEPLDPDGDAPPG